MTRPDRGPANTQRSADSGAPDPSSARVAGGDSCTCHHCTDLSAALDQLLLARLDVRRAAAEVDRVHRLDRLRDRDYDDPDDDWRARRPEPAA